MRKRNGLAVVLAILLYLIASGAPLDVALLKELLLLFSRQR